MENELKIGQRIALINVFSTGAFRTMFSGVLNRTCIGEIWHESSTFASILDNRTNPLSPETATVQVKDFHRDIFNLKGNIVGVFRVTKLKNIQ